MATKNKERIPTASTDDEAPIDPAGALAEPGAGSSDGPATDDAARETAIRDAAYRRFEARDGRGGGGSEEQDWLDAEAEVDGKTS